MKLSATSAPYILWVSSTVPSPSGQPVMAMVRSTVSNATISTRLSNFLQNKAEAGVTKAAAHGQKEGASEKAIPDAMGWQPGHGPDSHSPCTMLSHGRLGVSVRYSPQSPPWQRVQELRRPRWSSRQQDEHVLGSGRLRSGNYAGFPRKPHAAARLDNPVAGMAPTTG